MRTRILTVPLNEQGKIEEDMGIQNTDNLAEYHIPEEEFESLYHDGIFMEINRRCKLLIDDYESEVISASQLKSCVDLFQNRPGVFGVAAKRAIEVDTYMAMDF